MRVFLTRPFTKFARRADLPDPALLQAVERATRGLIDADLGGGVIKQRVARRGECRSGGFRVIILFRAGDRAVFVHGFAKNERANIRDDELAAFRLLAAAMLAYDEAALARAIGTGALTEVEDG